MPAAAAEKKAEAVPVDEQIRRRAYELYVQRGCTSGCELDDWLQAEEEIQAMQDRMIEEGE